MKLNKEESESLISELTIELDATIDGGRKNLVVPICPYCGHEGGKFGIYIGPPTEKKKPFMSHCFSCGKSVRDIEQLLRDINRTDLIPEEVVDFAEMNSSTPLDFLDKANEIDDSLEIVEMPEGFKTVRKNAYLKSRGFTPIDYLKFPVGTTRGLNFKFDDYVLFQIIDAGECVGYIGRHIWSKEEIEKYNHKMKILGKYQVPRYKNSNEVNEFVKLLYNYDSIIENETDTVIIVEGIFTCMSLIRKFNLYNNHRIAVVATFGKKISDIQIYKIQSKGVRTVVIGYDGDAVNAINKTADQLNDYFDVYIADIQDSSHDFDDMDFWEAYDTFSLNIKTPREYKLNKIQL